MTYTIEDRFPHSLLALKDGPCVSIYMTTHEESQFKEKDKIGFKNLMTIVISQLEKAFPLRDYVDLKTTLDHVYHDESLWTSMKQGFVLYANLNSMILYQVNKPFEALAIIASSFHIKPLLAYYQQHESYLVLALEADAFSVFVGNGHYLDPVVLASDIHTTLEEVLGSTHKGQYQTHGVYGGSMVGSTFHGHGGRKEMMELDKEKFFRYVNTIVNNLTVTHYPYPLVVLSHAVNHGLYRRLSTTINLIEPFLDQSQRVLSKEAIQDLLQTISKGRYDKHIRNQLDDLDQLKPHEESSSLPEIITAMYASKVDILFIQEDKVIPGVLVPENQSYLVKPLSDVQVDDVLDDLIQEATQHGTQVVMVPKSIMDIESGIRARFRY